MQKSHHQPIKIAVVIPCYKVKSHIVQLVSRIGKEVHKIYIIDDKCPENTGDHVAQHCCAHDERIQVLYHEQNQGVGGAVVTGYKQALKDNMTIVIKLDGDNQMDPALIPRFIQPIIQQHADYTKGNRFFNIAGLANMPRMRLFGNAVLSLVSKVASGYWNIMDPTNGYTAIHTSILRLLPLDKLARRYFFESDMLFRLNTVRAKVLDIPMNAHYGDEKSNLNIVNTALKFPPKYLACFFKRLFYSYFLRDFNAGTLEFISGIIFSAAGITYGTMHWIKSTIANTFTPTGTIMLATMLVFIGFQLLFSAMKYDIEHVPQQCLHPLLS